MKAKYIFLTVLTFLLLHVTKAEADSKEGAADNKLEAIVHQHDPEDSSASRDNVGSVNKDITPGEIVGHRLQEAQLKLRKVIIYTSIAIFILLIVVVQLLVNRYHIKKAAEREIRDKADNVNIVYGLLEASLNELKQIREQLIQSEKLASLGQLTAGIAHEIQNPLNFVNNFSELSSNLLADLLNSKSEHERLEISNDLRDNLAKIKQHGKRADSIVKNMLDHSRASSGNRQFTDINKLCDEYINLSYHGVKANTPGFKCEVKKDLQSDIPGIYIVSQDISRVLLNLYNNAFYAVNLKLQRNKNFEPLVSITTLSGNNAVTIILKDNGDGITNEIKDKIFNPFFTTKPAGEGTGLGLSLSHDIIKAHGGAISVESQAGLGTQFTLQLPLGLTA